MSVNFSASGKLNLLTISEISTFLVRLSRGVMASFPKSSLSAKFSL